MSWSCPPDYCLQGLNICNLSFEPPKYSKAVIVPSMREGRVFLPKVKYLYICIYTELHYIISMEYTCAWIYRSKRLWTWSHSLDFRYSLTSLRSTFVNTFPCHFMFLEIGKRNDNFAVELMDLQSHLLYRLLEAYRYWTLQSKQAFLISTAHYLYSCRKGRTAWTLC